MIFFCYFVIRYCGVIIGLIDVLSTVHVYLKKGLLAIHQKIIWFQTALILRLTMIIIVILGQMIPKQVMEKVKAGINPVDTCEVFEQVTIVFNDIPEFLDICTKCDGLQIVSMLNTMFGMFDYLSDKNTIYKVETVKVIRISWICRILITIMIATRWQDYLNQESCIHGQTRQ